MKKDIEVDKSLFKRVSRTKKGNKIVLPERVAEVNKHQHNADVSFLIARKFVRQPKPFFLDDLYLFARRVFRR